MNDSEDQVGSDSASGSANGSVSGNQHAENAGHDHKGKCPPYRVILLPLGEKDGGGWAAEVPDLPGCFAQGRTPQMAVRAIEGMMRDWLSYARSTGARIPQPVLGESEFSGKFTVRVSPPLHKRLSTLAELEGLSLNQYILRLVCAAPFCSERQE